MISEVRHICLKDKIGTLRSPQKYIGALLEKSTSGLDFVTGSVKGLAAKGNVTVDIERKDGKVTDYTLHSDNENIILLTNVIVKL